MECNLWTSPEHVRDVVQRLLPMADPLWARFVAKQSRVQTDGSPFQETFNQAQRDAASCWQSCQTAGERVELSEVLERWGVQVVEEPASAMDSHFIHFAVYDPRRNTVELSERAVGRVTEAMVEYGIEDLLKPVDVRAVVLWHECCHAMMRERVPRASGWLRRRPRSGFLARLTEEFTAVQFSKLATGLSYNPQLFQWLLVHTVNPNRAMTMYKDILEMSVMR